MHNRGSHTLTSTWSLIHQHIRRKMILRGRKPYVLFPILASCLILFHFQGFVENFLTDQYTMRSRRRASAINHTWRHSCPSNENKEIFAALLRYWDALSRQHNISYVIGLGSLLGQYRTQDVIPWDDDVDVLVDVTNFKILQSLAEERSFKPGWDRKFHLVIQPDFMKKEEKRRKRWSCTGKEVFFQIDRCSFVSPMARAILGYRALDIFPYVDKGSVVHDVELKKDYNKTHFFPFQACYFIKVSTWCPRNIRAVLETGYKSLTPEYVCRNGKWTRRGNYKIESAIKYLKKLITNLLNY